jgi:adenine/guanine/hypoxanthine permease
MSVDLNKKYTSIVDGQESEEEASLHPKGLSTYQPPLPPDHKMSEQSPNPLFRPSDQSRPSETGSAKPLAHMRESNLEHLTRLEFYQQENWVEELFEILFKIRRRGTTITAEVYYGIIHFISCLYCLAVIPQQLYGAGYLGRPTVVSVALCTGAGSILSGLFANLPFVLAPPTVVSIFLSVFLQQKGQGPEQGSIAVILSGFLLMLFGWRPLGTLTANLIPLPIQVGTAVGIGILTALAGSTEINLVQPGTYTILKIGTITPMICLSFAGVILICIGMRRHWKGSFCMAVVLCSIVWWWYDNSFPDTIAAVPTVKRTSTNGFDRGSTPLLTVDLLFLYVLYLNGLMTSLSNLAVLTREDSTIPRGRWIYIICGIFTVCAGVFQSAPILVSPESSASIKEGAKTGLSAVVAGVLFLIALFFSPIFEMVPPPGTSPVLVMIGVILFQNVSRIDWRNVTNAAPAFVVLFYIPFTYSIIQGIVDMLFSLLLLTVMLSLVCYKWQEYCWDISSTLQSPFSQESWRSTLCIWCRCISLNMKTHSNGCFI